MLQKVPKALIYGNLTNDKNIINDVSFLTPGGASFFSARTLTNLNVKVTLVSPYGDDFPKSKLPKVNFIPQNPNTEKTLLFKNIYKGKGERFQEVLNYKSADLAKPEDLIPEILTGTDILIVAPVINNISQYSLEKIVQMTKAKVSVLLPQGFFRKIENNSVIPVCCDYPRGIFRKFDVIVISEKDYPQIDKLVLDWASGKTLVVVTRASHPASVYFEGKKADYPAFKIVKTKDETGAGDIFASAFAYAYFKSKNIKNSIDFAHAAALLSLPLLSDQLQYGLKDIFQIAKKQGRTIEI